MLAYLLSTLLIMSPLVPIYESPEINEQQKSYTLVHVSEFKTPEIRVSKNLSLDLSLPVITTVTEPPPPPPPEPEVIEEVPQVVIEEIKPEPEPEVVEEKLQDKSTSKDVSTGVKISTTAVQDMAKIQVQSYGWSDENFSCLVKLWNKESNWDYQAENPSSGAYGIPQSLPGSKMSSAGEDWKTNPETQISWGLTYIKERYQTPCGAWNHSESNNWY